MLPELISNGGRMMWLLLASGAVAAAIFFERWLLFHREQINSLEFIAGVRNVLKRDNVVEAISICDATPGPVARLVKSAILNRDRGREIVRETLEDAGLVEVARLEERLPLLGTIAQIAPILGLLGTVIGFMDVFRVLQDHSITASPDLLAVGIWKALVCTATGLALAAPCYAGYNYLVTRVNDIVVDMEKASADVLTLVSELPKP
jgi:biopolymer transport protein ExbB